MSAELVLDQAQQGLVGGDVGRLQGHGEQLEAHVHHGVGVVAIVGVGQRDEEAEELTQAGQPVGDERSTCRSRRRRKMAFS